MGTTLTGKVVRLRPVEREDLRKRVEWINDPAVQATLNFRTPVSLVGTERWLERISSDESRRDFSVETIVGEKYIGFGGLLNIEPLARKAELYATIGDTSYWRGGFGTDVYAVLCAFGFEELGLERIYGYQLVHNTGAHRVVEKLGWVREGLLRRDLWSHGRLVDRYVVSILRDEWMARGRGDL